MAAEVRLANTPITDLDPTLTEDILYARLADILNKNDIDEIGFLPFLPDEKDTVVSEQQQAGKGTSSTYPFVVQEHGTKLGIPIYCWVPILDAASAVLKDAIFAVRRGNEASQLEGGHWWADPGRCQKVKDSTACLMILCPDSFTAMNARKRLVLERVLDPHKELALLDMALTFPRNCKSSGAWHHRRWLLCYIYKDSSSSTITTSSSITISTPLIPPAIIGHQLQVCHLAAERYPKCYYAWTMRHWLIEQLGQHWWAASLSSLYHHDSSDDWEARLRPLQDELERMRTHMQRNISDHSTAQHLQQCLLQLSGRWIVQRVGNSVTGSGTGSDVREVVLQWTRTELARRRQRRDADTDAASGIGGSRKRSAIRSAFSPVSLDSVVTTATMVEEGANVDLRASFPWVAKLWVTELQRTKDLIRTYPGHESLWSHLRFIYYGLCWLDSTLERDYHRTDGEAVGSYIQKNTEQIDDILFVSPETEEQSVKLLLNMRLSDNVDPWDVESEEKQKQCSEKYLEWVKRLELAP